MVSPNLKLLRNRNGTSVLAGPFAKAVDAMQAALKVAGVEFASRRLTEAIARQTIRAYIDAASVEDFVTPNNISPITLQLSEMKVGEEIVIELSSGSLVRSYMKTARKRMGNNNARWHQHVHADIGKTCILRVEDNSRPRKLPENNKKAMFLASISIGEYKLAPPGLFNPARSMEAFTKLQASRIVGKPSAVWRQRKIVKDSIEQLKIERLK